MTDKNYIKYRGKEISEKKAKGLLTLLKTGLYHPKLSEEESKEYSSWKEHYEKRKEGGRRTINFPINERGYLIWQLNNYFDIGKIIKSAEKVHNEIKPLSVKERYNFLHTEFTPADSI